MNRLTILINANDYELMMFSDLETAHVYKLPSDGEPAVVSNWVTCDLMSVGVRYDQRLDSLAELINADTILINWAHDWGDDLVECLDNLLDIDNTRNRHIVVRCSVDYIPFGLLELAQKVEERENAKVDEEDE